MHLKKLALGAAVALGALGLTGVAVAAVQNSHVLTVRLPDGGTAHIRYFGDTPPQVRFDPGSPFAPAAWPGPMAGFFDPGFPALDQAMARMDRQADLMFAQVQHLAAAAPGGDGLMRADFGQLPPGVTGYSVVSTMSPGQGACTRTVEYRSTGKGQPRVIRKMSGDCATGRAPSAASFAAGPPAPHLTSAAYHTAS